MSSTADRTSVALAPADGLQLLGEVAGSGYEQGASLVRRADGQMVQLGPLVYALLEEVDGARDHSDLAKAMCEKLGRDCDVQHVAAIAQKLAEQGLLAGSEANAPERVNPLLALRWKVVVTDPELTGRLTAPFRALFRPWVLVPVVAAFLAVTWFVLGEQGIASGAAQAFARPELILLLFVLGVAAAGFHELGHAAACRYGGGTPGAMGMGIYLVWPAFYTDVTDSYRLPKRARLRTDLGGLYFNAIVAVATFAAWLVLGIDSLLLLIGLQLVEMVKQLSPVIRADGYHILSDVTGVPDLYAHMVPTLKRLLPGHHSEEAALTGRARLIVTLWVLAIVPLLLLLTLSMVLLLPKLVASAWESGSLLVPALGDQVQAGAMVDVFVSLLRLVGLALPVLGGAYLAWRLLGGAGRRAVGWSRGRPARRALVVALAAGVAAALTWMWWPTGQYEPIRASDRGTIGQLAGLATAEPAATRAAAPAAPASPPADAARPAVEPGTHVAVSLIPEGGATDDNPAIFVITDPGGGGAPVLIASNSAAVPAAVEPTSGEAPAPTSAAAFSFALPDAPREGDTQALAVNRTDGGVTYTIAYSLVTVGDGDAVDQRNGAHAYANCTACTTVAVSFQVILVVGSSPMVTPVNIAEALNGNCPSCVTAAIANQIVVSVGAEPSKELLAQLTTELERLDELDELGADATPTDISARVTEVQQGINQLLSDSGLLVPEEGDITSTQAQPEEASEPDATPPSTAEETPAEEPEPEASSDQAPEATDAPVEPATTTTPAGAPAPQ
jgi:putative peptide zinc metalloprotease protein